MALSSTVVVRASTSADAELLTQLGSRAFQEAFSSDNQPEDLASYLQDAFYPDKQAAELADPLSKFFIAEVAGSAVGYAKLRKGQIPEAITGLDPIELERLYTLQAWVGKGIGKALMQACIDEARQTKHDTLWLGVWQRNERAQAFYRKWGFQIVGTHIFWVGSDPQTDWLMQKALSPINV